MRSWFGVGQGLGRGWAVVVYVPRDAGVAEGEVYASLPAAQAASRCGPAGVVNASDISLL